MTTWLPRGLVFAAGMVLVRLLQGSLINATPTNAGKISVGLVLLFGAAAGIWGFFDGAADARANPDPDRRRDLAMRWLVAGLVAGVLSGF
ncbi:MAG: B-4DMT family transporter, partial [Mycobacterium sp.]